MLLDGSEQVLYDQLDVYSTLTLLDSGRSS
jgi:hypothetical protein